MEKLIPQNNFIFYTTPEGKVSLDVLLQNETIWLTQEQMSTLFERERSVITKHIGNVFSEGELEEKSNVQILHISASDRPVKFYNLDVIISVGYRVKSQRGTQFRIWATQTLKEFIVKGFVLDDARLKQGETVFGKDYFRELLERVRSIRASERRIYQQVTDVFAECSIDYDPKSDITKNFYALVQNKFHFAIAGRTAAEIVFKNADAKKDNMGLTTFKGSKVRKQDVTISKNYLNKEELDILNRIVTMYLDYAELQAKSNKQMFMTDWREKLDAFLQFNGQEILKNTGKVSKKIADKLATEKYEEFHKNRLKKDTDELDNIDNAIKKIKE
jgi:hypothetical protein